MKSMVKAALAAICVLGASGLARAQDDGAAAASSKPSDSAISATSMGSMPSGGRRQAADRATRAQVKEEYLRMQKSGIFSVSTSCTKAASSGRGPARRGRACIGWGSWRDRAGPADRQAASKGAPGVLSCRARQAEPHGSPPSVMHARTCLPPRRRLVSSRRHPASLAQTSLPDPLPASRFVPCRRASARFRRPRDGIGAGRNAHRADESVAARHTASATSCAW